MAKSPAVLFYTSDFLVGTMLMNHEQRGAYITLLCLQHQKGRLSQTDVSAVSVDKTVLEKFTVDEDGNFYNERMEEEIEKRNTHCEKQRSNVLKRYQKSTTVELNNIPNSYDGSTTVLPLENENENENNNIINNYLNNNINSSVSENNNTPVDKSFKSNKSLKSPIVANWRTSFEIYLASATEAYNALRSDTDWVAKQQRYNPNLNILLSLEKAFCEYWGTEAGWMHRKTKKKTEAINWKATYTNALSMRSNQVWQDNPKKPLTYQEDVLLRRARGEDI